jgi:polar amino acid transport system substrate-binding protein
MTANAMIADREECLAAGMNDHIAKPIKPDILYKTLVRRLRTDVDVNDYLNNRKPPVSVSLEGLGELSQLEGVDVKAGLISVNNDWNLYTKLLYKFYNRHQHIKKEIQTELARGNRGVAQRLAHTIKGVAGTIGANVLSEISLQLESAIKNNHSDRIPDLLDRFDTEIACMMASLDAFIESKGLRQTDGADGSEELENQPSKAMEASGLKKLFRELSDLIDKHDADVIKLVAEIKTGLGPSHISDRFLELESQINSFKFEQAKQTLVQTLKELDL